MKVATLPIIVALLSLSLTTCTTFKPLSQTETMLLSHRAEVRLAVTVATAAVLQVHPALKPQLVEWLRLVQASISPTLNVSQLAPVLTDALTKTHWPAQDQHLVEVFAKALLEEVNGLLARMPPAPGEAFILAKDVCGWMLAAAQ